jgi:hypothetical protein
MAIFSLICCFGPPDQADPRMLLIARCPALVAAHPLSTSSAEESFMRDPLDKRNQREVGDYGEQEGSWGRRSQHCEVRGDKSERRSGIDK